MLKSFLVIDDFYANPQEVRQAALAMDYPAPAARENYPGRMSAQPALWPECDRMFSAILGEPLRGNTRQLHGYFRISLAGDPRGADIHVDVDNTWAGVLYLTAPEHCRGGTEFFRHKKFGTDHAPIRREELAIYGARTSGEVLDKTIVPDGRDRSKWEHLMTVPMRFNRLILFRSWFWHTAGEAFGDCKENGRLVQLFFFESAAAARR